MRDTNKKSDRLGSSMNFTVQNVLSVESEGNYELDDKIINQVSYTLIEEALDEIKEFISIMYGATVRFYNTLLVYHELDEMKEDMIERVTTMIFHHPHITQLVMTLCKIATQDDQKIFEKRLREGIKMDIKPHNLSVSNFFTLDHSSNIIDYFFK